MGWDVGSSPAGPCFAWFRSTESVLVGSQLQLVVVVVGDDHLHRIAYSVGSPQLERYSSATSGRLSFWRWGDDGWMFLRTVGCQSSLVQREKSKST